MRCFCCCCCCCYRRNADEFDVHIYTCFHYTSLWNRFLSLLCVYFDAIRVCLFINGKRENSIAERNTVLLLLFSSSQRIFYIVFLNSVVSFIFFLLHVLFLNSSNSRFLLAQHFPIWTFDYNSTNIFHLECTF